MRLFFGWILWLLPVLLPLAGCGPEIPAEDLGTVRFDVPTVPGADKPYEMPELAPQPAPDSANPASDSANPASDSAKPPPASAKPSSDSTKPASDSAKPPSDSAAEETALKSKVDALVQPLVASGIPVGFVVGIVERGKTHVFGYGKVARDADKTPDGNSIFEIGSVTKVFTGLLLADMVERRLLALEDPVEKFLPETVTVPQQDGRAITLLDLATQTSGLPRLPGNFAIAAAKDPRNPYADYTVEQLYEFLSKHALARKPGTQFEYSNLGVGLLGHALARRADTTYEKLVVDRICSPLGMNDTRIALSEQQRSRLVQGYGPRGRPVANWDIPTLAGAGALRSTVNDMLVFLKANLGLHECPLAAAMELSHSPRRDTDRPDGKIALAWHIRSDNGVLWHNGQTGGYHSILLLQKQRKVGVVVLSNTAHRVGDDLGGALMALLSGRPVKPLKVDLPEGGGAEAERRKDTNPFSSASTSVLRRPRGDGDRAVVAGGTWKMPGV